MADSAGHAVPKYREIADDLRARIEAGEFPVGSQLPTKKVLMGRHGVALNTVDRALEELRREGLAETEQGRGSFVLALPAQQDEGQDGVQQSVEAHEEDIVELYARLGWERPSQQHGGNGQEARHEQARLATRAP